MSPVTYLRAAVNGASANLQGMLWMVLAGLIFASFTGIVRHVSSEMDPMQAAFLRYAFGLIFIAPFVMRMRLGSLRPGYLALHGLRGLVHGIGVLCWFIAMSRIPLAEVTALGFTSPVFATVGAVLFLGERVRLRRIGAVCMGFAGALIILRPGLEVIDVGAIAMLIAAPLFAVSKIVAKVLTHRESTPTIVASLSVIVTIVLLPPALAVWRPPTWEEYGWMLLTAALATLGHLAMVQAFRSADLTVTQPVEFLQLVWATLLGFYAFSETPDAWVWIGGAVIIGSATYIAHREALTRRNAVGTEEPPSAPH